MQDQREHLPFFGYDDNVAIGRNNIFTQWHYMSYILVIIG